MTKEIKIVFRTDFNLKLFIWILKWIYYKRKVNKKKQNKYWIQIKLLSNWKENKKIKQDKLKNNGRILNNIKSFYLEINFNTNNWKVSWLYILLFTFLF